MRTGYWRKRFGRGAWEGPSRPPRDDRALRSPCSRLDRPPEMVAHANVCFQTIAHLVVLLNYLQLVLQGHPFMQSVLGLVVDALDHAAEVRAKHPVAQRSAVVLEGVHRVQRADAAGLAVVDEPRTAGGAAGHVAHHALVG